MGESQQPAAPALQRPSLIQHLHWCHPGGKVQDIPRPPACPLSLQPLLPESVHYQPGVTSNCHLQGEIIDKWPSFPQVSNIWFYSWFLRFSQSFTSSTGHQRWTYEPVARLHVQVRIFWIHLQSLLLILYRGSISVRQEELQEILKSASTLQIRGKDRSSLHFQKHVFQAILSHLT